MNYRLSAAVLLLLSLKASAINLTQNISEEEQNRISD
jgi:hypothetical protein